MNLIMALVLLCVAGIVHAGEPADAEPLVQQGRAHLRAYNRDTHNTAELDQAERALAAALAANPAHPEACVLHPWVRFQQLAYHPEVTDLMNRLGLGAEGRDPWKWKALPVYPLPDHQITGTELAQTADRLLMKETEYALACLDRIQANWPGSISFTPEDFPRSKGNLSLDRGDIFYFQFLLKAMKIGLLASRAYDYNTAFATQLEGRENRSVLVRDNAVRNILQEHPKLGTVADAGALASAQPLLEEVVAAFHTADRYVQTRPADVRNTFCTVGMLDQVRPYVMSLLGPSRVAFTRDQEYLLNARRLFEKPYLDRKLLPEFTDQNEALLGRFPDPTFGGLIPDMTPGQLVELLRWNRRASGATEDLFDVVYHEGRFIAVGARGTLLTSTDSAHWQRLPSPSEATLKGVAAGPYGWVAVGSQGVIVYSDDGTTWQLASAATGEDLESVAAGSHGWVAVGLNGVILNSRDGRAWETVPSGTSRHLWRVRWGKGRFVALGSGGVALSSPDGTTWSQPRENGKESLVGADLGVTMFYGVTYEGSILSSVDGVKWDPVGLATNFPDGLWNLKSTPNEYIAVGNNGTIALSPDGQHWVRQISRSYEPLRAAAEGDGVYVVVGGNGRILSSYSYPDARSSNKATASFYGSTADAEQQIRQGLPDLWSRFPKHGGGLALVFRGAQEQKIAPRTSLPVEAALSGLTATALDTSIAKTAVAEPAAPASPRAPPSPLPSTASPSRLRLLTPLNARAGDTIRISISALPKNEYSSGAWIAFYRGDATPDTDYIRYTFLNNLRDGEYDVEAPDEPGTYHFRVFKNDAYDVLERSAIITVK